MIHWVILRWRKEWKIAIFFLRICFQDLCRDLFWKYLDWFRIFSLMTFRSPSRRNFDWRTHWKSETLEGRVVIEENDQKSGKTNTKNLTYQTLFPDLSFEYWKRIGKSKRKKTRNERNNVKKKRNERNWRMENKKNDRNSKQMIKKNRKRK